jgi:hypothetical protein
VGILRFAQNDRRKGNDGGKEKGLRVVLSAL